MTPIDEHIREFHEKFPELQEGAITQALGAAGKSLAGSALKGVGNMISKVPIAGKMVTSGAGAIGSAIQAGKQAAQGAQTQKQDLANAGMNEEELVQSAIDAIKSIATVAAPAVAATPAPAATTGQQPDTVVQEKLFSTPEYKQLQILLEKADADTIKKAASNLVAKFGSKTAAEIAKDPTLFKGLMTVINAAKGIGMKGFENINPDALTQAQTALSQVAAAPDTLTPDQINQLKALNNPEVNKILGI